MPGFIPCSSAITTSRRHLIIRTRRCSDVCSRSGARPPAGCLFLLPLWPPVLVAEQIGTLASIAQGRFIMQCGLGYGEAQFAAMGANIKTRPSAFEESLDIVRRLLAGETVSSARRFRVTKASFGLRPAEPVEV